MGLLQSTASAGDPLSMSEVVSHFGQSGEKSLRQFLRNGGIVPSSKSTTTNISGSGSGSGSSGSISVSVSAGSQTYQTNYVTGQGYTGCKSLTANYNQYFMVGDADGFRTYSSSGCSGNSINLYNTSGNWYSAGNGSNNPSGHVENPYENQWAFYTRVVQTVYTITFTNNYPNSVTITSGTGGARTIAAGASAQVQTNGGSNSWSFSGTTTSSTSINSGIPTSGTVSLLNFLSADNGA